jgi:hypothetical protein
MGEFNYFIDINSVGLIHITRFAVFCICILFGFISTVSNNKPLNNILFCIQGTFDHPRPLPCLNRGCLISYFLIFFYLTTSRNKTFLKLIAIISIYLPRRFSNEISKIQVAAVVVFSLFLMAFSSQQVIHLQFHYDGRPWSNVPVVCMCL